MALANPDGGLVVPRPSAELAVPGDLGVSLATTAVNGISWIPPGRVTETRATGLLSTQASVATLVNGNGNDVHEENDRIPFPELEGQEPAEQLETLKEMHDKTTRLREGAENLLRMNLPDNARVRVESERDQANNKLDAINRRIESITRRKRPFGLNGLSPALLKRRLDAGHSRQKDDGGDDFRTAKQQAHNLLRTLLSYSRTHLSPVSTSSASSSASPPPPATEEELQKARIQTMNNLIAILQRNVRVRFEISMEELFQAVTPALIDSMPTKSRATSYRLLRHSLVDQDSVERLLEHPLEWYILKTLARDNKHAVEREQAVKLIRAIVEVGSERQAPHASVGLGRVPLSEPIMRAFIAVAEHNEDPLRQICVETLVEILLVDVDLMARTGGTRVLLQAMVDGPIELVPLMATAFLYIVDSPKTRAYIHSGTDIEIALSGITDAYGKGPTYAERMRSSSKVITVILRTWSGLMYLCMNDMLAIRMLVNTLRIPSLETREVILDLFFDLLSIDTPEWYQTFIDGRRLTMYRRHRPTSQPAKEKEATAKAYDKLKLTDQYISLLTAILARAGLLEALTAMLEETTTGSALSRKATLLIGEFLQIVNKVLPLEFAAKIQSIPRVFELAADYGEGEHRIVGTSALGAIDSFNRHRARLQPISVAHSRQRANSVEDHVRRGQRQVEQVKIKLAMQMDDKAFQNSIIETQVMLTREHAKWNYDTLLDLIEGPLLNSKRLEEAIKVSKFVKRLMTFFHPLSRRFSDIKKSKANLKWIKLGCTMLTTLMANPDGVKYLLTEDEFLPQIVKCFSQVDPHNGSGSAEFDPIFSKKRVEETLTSGYFEMLGVLSKQKDGLELLEKHKVFTAFYHLGDHLPEDRPREDLIKLVMENLDYGIDGHSRIFLSKALTLSPLKSIRLHATKHLGHLIENSLSANAWMLRLLLTQLYDPEPEVCEVAVQYLEEACESQDVLKIVVDMQPTLEHLGNVANSLLYKFMSTPVGFRYLYDVGFIEREMDVWLEDRNFHYVVEIEVYISRELNFNLTEDVEEESQSFDSPVPPHFYGELAKTDLGCQVLQEMGHFSEFAHFIRQHALESDDLEIIHKLKSVLWAVGNVATGEGGLHFLEEEEIIPVILEISEQSPVLSVRGTCFFTIGLISSTAQGAEMLDDLGWESTLSPLGYPTGLCIPSDIDKFISILPWEEAKPQMNMKDLIPPSSQEEVDVLAAIGSLANTVIANAASRSLAKMKSKSEYRSVFSSSSSYYRVLHILSTRRYRLPVRRYILELFDVQLDASVVQTLVECSKAFSETGTSSTSTSPKVTKAQPRVVSMFGRSVRGRRPSESDDDESLGSSDEEEKTEVGRPVSLLPVKRVSGFDGGDQSPLSE